MLSSKRALQISVALAGIVPVSAGLAGVCIGPSMVPGAGDVPIPLDSHYRYLSGLLLGIGLTYWSLIPEIEKKGSLFRSLTAIVFVGGLARLGSVVSVGVPDKPMLFGLSMELLVTPLITLWQYRVAKTLRRS